MAMDIYYHVTDKLLANDLSEVSRRATTSITCAPTCDWSE